jgi:hypothetical protein
MASLHAIKKQCPTEQSDEQNELIENPAWPQSNPCQRSGFVDYVPMGTSIVSSKLLLAAARAARPAGR